MVDVRTLPIPESSGEITITLDDLAREGARRMIAAALRAEADEYVARFDDDLDEDGHRLVVRNGRARERKVTVGSGTVPVRAPRVNDKRVDEEPASGSGSPRWSLELPAVREDAFDPRSPFKPPWWAEPDDTTRRAARHPEFPAGRGRRSHACDFTQPGVKRDVVAPPVGEPPRARRSSPERGHRLAAGSTPYSGRCWRSAMRSPSWSSTSRPWPTRPDPKPASGGRAPSQAIGVHTPGHP